MRLTPAPANGGKLKLRRHSGPGASPASRGYRWPVSRWAEIRDGAVVYEDAAALVLNKPAGLSVMGERHETDLVRLAAEAGEKLYPAHRIDKVTSGALLLARELRWHGGLTRQFNRRTVDKVYLAITRSTGLPARGTIDLPLSVGRKNRVRVAANRAAIAFDEPSARWSVPADEEFSGMRTYPSVTTFFTLGGDGQHTLLAVHPVTGRRHQIRVHLSLDRPSDRGRPAVRRARRRAHPAALLAAGFRRGVGRRRAYPGRGAPRPRLLGSTARPGPAARLVGRPCGTGQPSERRSRPG